VIFFLLTGLVGCSTTTTLPLPWLCFNNRGVGLASDEFVFARLHLKKTNKIQRIFTTLTTFYKLTFWLIK
jgi:hypothetical protein